MESVEIIGNIGKKWVTIYTTTPLTFTCSKSARETLEIGLKYSSKLTKKTPQPRQPKAFFGKFTKIEIFDIFSHLFSKLVWMATAMNYYQANIYLFKVNNINTPKRYEIFLKSTIKRVK